MMLQRAASSARSWWWASHIRTKQSNWLEQNLQEMEMRVQAMLKLIDEDGDSFAKRAEMYYKRRPELIYFVEEFYKAYRGLADRYDHISGDLHNARSTIATAFPDQVPLVEPTEESSKGKFGPVAHLAEFGNALSKKLPQPPPPSLTMKPNSSTPKKDETSNSIISEPAMDAATAQKEIDGLQKQILALMKEKEFMKSSYEVGLAKYWEIETQILELQAKTCFLQEEHGLSSGIEAEEEQTITAVTVLNSCQKMLGNLQEEQQKAMAEAKIESERIKIMEEKLNLLKDEFLKQHPDGHKLDDEKPIDAHPAIKTLEEEVCNLRKENTEYQEICHKIVKQLEIDVNDSLSIPEYSHLIDDIVSKIVTLESEVSTQTIQIMRMKTETNHLQDNMQRLQEDKMSLLNDSKTMTEKIKELEEELVEIQGLNLHIEEQKAQLQAELTEACSKLEDLTAKLKRHQDHNGRENLAFELPKEKGASGSSLSHQNQKEGENSALVRSGIESVLEPQQEKYAIEYSASHQNHNECEFSAVVQSGNESALQFQQERDAIETSSSFRDHNEGKISAISQSGSESALGLPQEKDDDETSALTETEKEKDLKDGMQTEESDFIAELNKEIIKPDSGFEEHKFQEESASECDHDVKQGMHQETDNHSTSIINGCHEAKHEKEAETYHKSSNIASGLENLSLELVDSQTWLRFLEGMEDRERTLLSEYTSILRNYKETKRKLSELQRQNHDIVFEKMEKIRLLETEGARKDGEIQSLKQKLAILHMDCELPDTKIIKRKRLESRPSRLRDSNVVPLVDGLDYENVVDSEDQSTGNGYTTETPPNEREIKIVFSQDTEPPSAMEEKFRQEIDAVLEDNLEFWLRFSASFNQIKKFRTTIEEAQVELSKFQKSKEEGNNCTATTASTEDNQSMKDDGEAIQKQLTELQGELIIWLEQNALLKEELKHRFSSLCDIQEELSRVSKANLRNSEAQLTEYQAEKFQGEVSIMQQENNKVADELQAGLDHVRGLQLELGKTLLKLKENFGLPETKRHHHPHHISHMRNTLSRTRIPLRSFLQLGSKPPKKPSLFSCVNPALQKQYSDLRAGRQ